MRNVIYSGSIRFSQIFEFTSQYIPLHFFLPTLRGQNEKCLYNNSFIFFLFLMFVTGCTSNSQPTKSDPDSDPDPVPDTRPVVLVDEAHNNYHTVKGRFAPFASLLRDKGYNVKSSNSLFASNRLQQAKVLVISNALAVQNINNWTRPTPSDFSDEEIEVVRGWVYEGGSLLLIADHMPFPGAAHDLATVFGVDFK